MKSIHFQMTEEAYQVAESLRGAAPRNPTLEDLLWRSRKFSTEAKRLGIDRPERPTQGPKGKKDERTAE